MAKGSSSTYRTNCRINLPGDRVPSGRERSPPGPRARRTRRELARTAETAWVPSPRCIWRGSSNPPPQVIRNWVRPVDRDAGRRQDGLTTTEQEELRGLLREVRQLWEERPILSAR